MRRAVQETTLLSTVVLLALVVWFVIVDTENQEIEARLGFSLEVETLQLGSDLIVTGDPLPVTVSVIGREADVEAARPEHFRATISLRNRTAGRHSLPIRVDTLEGDVRVRAVQPETAVVILQETVEREVPVIVELYNPPPLGFSVGVSTVAPATAIVSGIAFEVEAVDAVVARLDLGGASVSVDRDVTLEARTASGGAVTEVVINPRFAVVSVPIEQEVFRRTVSILPLVLGTPATGYRIRTVRATPPVVDVLVPVDVLNEDVEVTTGPVDVSGRDQDLLIEAPLVFGDRAAPAADSETAVRIVVVIEPVLSSITLPISVEPTLLPGALRLDRAYPQTAEVTVRGPIALLSELEGPLSPIRVNLSSFEAGLHRIELTWSPPVGLELVELAPSQLTVTLSRIPEQTPIGDEDSLVEDEPNPGEQPDRSSEAEDSE